MSQQGGVPGTPFQRTFYVQLPPEYTFEGRLNASSASAQRLDFIEDPPGSGYFYARGIGSVDPESDSDYWYFDALEDDRVSITVDVTMSGSLRPHLSFLQSVDIAGGHNRNAFISNTRVPSDGRHELEIRRYDGNPGVYKLRVDLVRGIQIESDRYFSNGTIANANVLDMAVDWNRTHATVAGAVMDSTDIDIFRIGTFDAGNNVEIRTRLPSISTLDPRVELLNSAGTVITDNDGNPNDGNVSAVIPADGVYYVRMRANSGAGLYGLYLLDIDVLDLQLPRITSVSRFPADGGTTEHLISTFTVGFSKKMDPAPINTRQPIVARMGDSFYFLTPGGMTWANAQAYAQSLGGNLASVENAQKQAFLQKWFSAQPRYIGLTRIGGQYAWVNGAPYDYTNWAPNRPRNYDVNFIATTGLWDDLNYNPGYLGIVELVSPLDTDGDGIPDVIDEWPNDPHNAIDIREAGPDGLFDTEDDIIYRVNPTATYTDQLSLTYMIAGGPLGAGNYRLRISEHLTDPLGNMLDGNDDGVIGDPYIHYFTVEVPPQFKFESRSNDSVGSAEPLELVEDSLGSGYFVGLGIGSIDPTTDNDNWTFHALAGDRVSITVDVIGSLLNSHVQLYNPAGTYITADTSAGAGNSSFISNLSITSDGHHRVVVQSSSWFGNYRLRIDLVRGIAIESDAHSANSTIANANPLSLVVDGTRRLGTMAGAVMQDSDIDFFNLGMLEVGDVVQIDTRLPSVSSLNPRVQLVNSAGTVIDDNDGNPNDGYVTAVIPAIGTYYVRMQANSGAGVLGIYLLDVEVEMIPLTVASISRIPADGATTDQVIGSFAVTFSKTLNVEEVNASQPVVVRLGDSWFFRTPTAMSWTNAQAHAVSLGGNLASVTTPERQALLQEWFPMCWIGLTRSGGQLTSTTRRNLRSR